MKLSEAISLDEETFKSLCKENGYATRLNSNHKEAEKFEEFVLAGCNDLLRNSSDLVPPIIPEKV